MHINDHNPLLPYLPAADRYDSMKYRYCGNSGIQLPEISLASGTTLDTTLI
jgi:L-glyceraldehyde 3-phosphate reductase